MDLPRTIYAIQHNKTKRIYVGSSVNAKKRYLSHMTSLRNHKHPNKLMQEDFDAYGEDYSLFLLEEIKEYSNRSKEYEWMHKLGTYDPEVGYNFKDALKGIDKKIPLKDGIPVPIRKPNPVEKFIDEQER